MFTPQIHIEIDGIDVSKKIWHYLESCIFEDHEDKETDTITMFIANSPSFLIPDIGSRMKLWIGYKEDSLHYFGNFTIDEVSLDLKPSKMSIVAKSVDFTGNITKEKKDREWENISLVDLATQIAEYYDCVVRVAVDIFYQHIAQTNESDLHFLERLSSEAGCLFSVRDGVFLIMPPSCTSRTELTISYSEVSGGRFTFIDRTRYGAVSARWWDSNEAAERIITVGEGTPAYSIKRRFGSPAEAEVVAKNILGNLRMNQVEAELEMAGRPNVVAGADIHCEGFPGGVDGTYRIKSASHQVSKQSWSVHVVLAGSP